MLLGGFSTITLNGILRVKDGWYACLNLRGSGKVRPLILL